MPLGESLFTFPIFNHSRQEGPFQIGPYQLVVEVSLTPRAYETLPDGATRFPAVVDTGHGHNFSIREAHLRAHAKLDLDSQYPEGHVTVRDSHGKHVVRAYPGVVWIHPRVRGYPPFRIPIDGDFTCYRIGDSAVGPPFPLLGARALATVDAFLGVDYGALVFALEFPQSGFLGRPIKPR